MKKIIFITPLLLVLLAACHKTETRKQVLVITSDEFIISTGNNQNDNYQYNQSGMLTKAYGNNNIYLSSYQYDANNLVVLQTVLYNNNPFGTAKFTHDVNGKLTSVETINATGVTTGYSNYLYYSDHYQENRLNGSGTLQSYRIYYYTPDGKNISYKLYYTNITLPPIRTTYTYDNKKNPLSILSAKGSLPFVNSNNVLGYSDFSATGMVLATSSSTFNYNQYDYPVKEQLTTKGVYGSSVITTTQTYVYAMQ